MTKTIRVDIVRPVNPLGLSFVKYCWGVIGSRDQRAITLHRSPLASLLRKVGETIVERVGEGKFITSSIEFEFEDSKPIRARILKIEIWTKTEELEEEIEVSL